MTTFLILDTETTKLEQPALTPLEAQPEILELGLWTVTIAGPRAKWSVVRSYASLVKPRGPISEEVTKITGLTAKHVAKAPRFPGILPELARTFRAVPILLGHNISFDLAVLGYELERLGRVRRFPWPETVHDTIEASRSLNPDKFLKLGELYEKCFGHPYAGKAHRVTQDCEMTYLVAQSLCKKGLLAL